MKRLLAEGATVVGLATGAVQYGEIKYQQGVEEAPREHIVLRDPEGTLKIKQGTQEFKKFLMENRQEDVIYDGPQESVE